VLSVLWPFDAETSRAILVWGLIATAVMSSLLEGSQYFGFSRISLPFLFGTFVTGRRDRAVIYGFVLYALGGLLFAWFYALAFTAIAHVSWWVGGLMGLAHGAFLVAVFLPLLPFFHPRMRTDYDGPASRPQLEPPGPFGLNYGRRTPLITVVAQTVFGALLGATLGPQL
jgi:hypothetical protein